MEFYIFPLYLTPAIGLDADAVIKFHWRQVIIKQPNEDECGRKWKEISKLPYFDFINDEPAKIRVVLLVDGNVIVFGRDGNQGYVNGKPVEFRKDVRDWFTKFVKPFCVKGGFE